ncbi:MAG: carboxypeptidase-like regulatory domain-containing protein [Thermoguttaceae bacterium]
MKTFLKISICIAFTLVAFTFTGCGSNRLKGLVPCWGTVTWEGEPVEGARVSFVPKSDPNGRSAFGLTDASGKFKMTTLNTDDGVFPGEYYITISKRTAERGNSPPMENEGPHEGFGAAMPVREAINETFHIPPMYSNKETSGFEINVTSKGDKKIELEMKGTIEEGTIPQQRGGSRFR